MGTSSNGVLVRNLEIIFAHGSRARDGKGEVVGMGNDVFQAARAGANTRDLDLRRVDTA
jgi:hypothetical protein